MNRILSTPLARLTLITLLIASAGGILPAQELAPIALPAPRTSGGKPLLDTLKARKSIREFKADPLPPQVLADLLWAGFGINRPDNAHRTAPSAMNSQEVDLYVATAVGVSRYDATQNRLEPVVVGDLRTQINGQDFMKQVPVVILFIADLARLTKAKPADKEHYAAVDTGFISQNIYLYCASEGLATVVHELNKVALAEKLKLRPDQRIILAQSVGYPK